MSYSTIKAQVNSIIEDEVRKAYLNRELTHREARILLLTLHVSSHAKAKSIVNSWPKCECSFMPPVVCELCATGIITPTGHLCSCAKTSLVHYPFCKAEKSGPV